jgi:hypothetical protein
MGCCSNCFGDEYLLEEVFPQHSSTHGTCEYCGSTEQYIIDPVFFRDMFEILLGAYSQRVDGIPLINNLQNDWNLFPTDIITTEVAQGLLADILGDDDISQRLFRPNDSTGVDTFDSWSIFREELRHRNRFFLASNLNLNRLQALLVYLEFKPLAIPPMLYRARIQEGDNPIPLNDMGAPPARLASHGRANPPGIPYLYMASDPRNAISELRPHTSDIATVAELSLSPGLRFIDLRFPRRTASPFKIDDEVQLTLLRHDLTFLDQLGIELARPVNPRSAQIEYLPSQYLCEFIKHCGYDGVLYRSSVGTGVNYALFYPAKAALHSSKVYSVDRVSVDVSQKQL